MPRTDQGYFHIDILNRSLNGKKYGCCRLGGNPAGAAGSCFPSQNNGGPKNFICVEKDEAFQVMINTIDQRDKNTYGSVLFLDG